MNKTLLDKLCVDLIDGTARNISPTVLVSQLTLPDMPESMHTAFVEAVLAENSLFDAGDTLSTTVPPPTDLAAVLANWAYQSGLAEVPSHYGTRLLACEGSWFHCDCTQDEYRRAAFSVLWLEDESPWDLVFPLIGMRVPLSRGTQVIFDSCNIHGVVWRDSDRFVEENFWAPGFQMFFSTEHQYASPILRQKMSVEIRPIDSFPGTTPIQGVKIDPHTGTITF